MKRISFWDEILGDVGWREREAINDAAEALEAQKRGVAWNDERIDKLLALDTAQSDEIERLRDVIGVLSTLLVETKVLDEDVLSMRIKDSLRKLEEAKRPSLRTVSDGSPYRGHGGKKKAPPPTKTIDCERCGVEFRPRTTHTICSKCRFGTAE